MQSLTQSLSCNSDIHIRSFMLDMVTNSYAVFTPTVQITALASVHSYIELLWLTSQLDLENRPFDQNCVTATNEVACLF